LTNEIEAESSKTADRNSAILQIMRHG